MKIDFSCSSLTVGGGTLGVSGHDMCLVLGGCFTVEYVFLPLVVNM